MPLNQSAVEILEQAYFSEHPDEEDVLKQLPALLENCRHFADIGASLGQYALHASRIMRNGRIDAFEADPARADKLKLNCADWASGTTNTIAAHHLAVARTGGRITFFSTSSNVSGGLFPNALAHLDEDMRAKVTWTQVDVPAVSLDEFYAGGPAPDFIKMDIEGAEGDALLGAARLLRQRRTRWLIELHGFDGGWQPQQVIDFMKANRYDSVELAPWRVLFTPVSLLTHWKQTLMTRARALARRMRSKP